MLGNQDRERYQKEMSEARQKGLLPQPKSVSQKKRKAESQKAKEREKKRQQQEKREQKEKDKEQKAREREEERLKKKEEREKENQLKKGISLVVIIATLSHFCKNNNEFEKIWRLKMLLKISMSSQSLVFSLSFPFFSHFFLFC